VIKPFDGVGKHLVIYDTTTTRATRRLRKRTTLAKHFCDSW